MLYNRMSSSNEYKTRLQICFVIIGGHFIFLGPKDTYLLSLPLEVLHEKYDKYLQT